MIATTIKIKLGALLIARGSKPKPCLHANGLWWVLLEVIFPPFCATRLFATQSPLGVFINTGVPVADNIRVNRNAFLFKQTFLREMFSNGYLILRSQRDR